MKSVCSYLAVATIGLLLAGCPTNTAPGPAGGAGAPAGGTKRIVFLTNGSDPFWDACRSGLDEGAKQFEGRYFLDEPKPIARYLAATYGGAGPHP